MSDSILDRIACQTIVFGRRFTGLEHLENAMSLVADSGFTGVEFSQAPHSSALGVPDIETLLRVVNGAGLELIGLSGGTLDDRLRFLNGARCKYLYTDRDDRTGILQAASEGYIVGLHPNLFGGLETMRRCLELFVEVNTSLGSIESGHVKLILDTAHLSVVGAEVLGTVQQFIGDSIGIHLKDWSDRYGSSSRRYSRGFCNLGDGDVPIDNTLDIVVASQYDGWLIWELDWPRRSIRDELHHAAEWLFARLRSRLELDASHKKEQLRPKESVAVFDDECHRYEHSQIDRVSRTMYAKSHTRQSAYRIACETVKSLTTSKQVELWANLSSQESLTLLHSTTKYDKREWSRKWSECRCAESIRKQRVLRFDITKGVVADHHLRDHLNLSSMLSIPVTNPYNSHSTYYILNIFDDEVELRQYEYELLGDALGTLFEHAIDNDISAVARQIDRSLLTQKYGKQSVNVPLARQTLCDTVRDRVDADMAMYIQAGQADVCWIDRVSSLSDRISLLSEVESFSPGREFSLSALRIEHSRQFLDTSDLFSGSKYGTGMSVPIKAADGQIDGAILCIRTGERASQLFTDDDSSIVESVMLAARSNLLNLERTIVRSDSRRRMRDALNQPVCRLGGDISRIEKYPQENIPDLPIPRDIRLWLDAMRQVMQGNKGPISLQNISLTRTPTFLMKDVVAAAVRQSSQVAKSQGLSVNRIRYAGLRSVPMVRVDKIKFQRLFLNLISNAIKYALNDSEAFSMEIDGEWSGSELILRCRDFGRGFSEKFREKVFEEGFRVPTDTGAELSVAGDGIGLAYVRQIVEAHGGTIAFASCSTPTTVIMRFTSDIVIRPIRGI